MKKYLIILLFSTFIQAQQKEKQAFTLGEVNTIQSVILGENRILNVYLPSGYNENTIDKFPVIYVLDGSANEDFIHIAGLVQFMNMYDLLPKSIVVGIANVDRKRDFTFPTTVEEDKKTFPTTGNSEKFIAFLEQEVQPFMSKNYKISEDKTIIGQSLGGLLATEILLKKPALFTNYVIVSPSLWWNNESLLELAKTNLPTITNKKIFVAVGKEGKVMENDANKLHQLVKEKSNNKVLFEFLANEDHATILHNAVYKAFEFIGKKK